MTLSLLFDARLVLPKPTGIGQYIASLLPELIQLAPDWHFHILRQPDSWPDYGLATLTAPNVTHHLSSIRHMSLKQQVALPRLAKALGVDLLHYPHFDAPVLLGNQRTVVTIHDAKYLVHPQFFPHLSRLKRLYMRWSFATSLKHAAAVITVSHHTAQDMVALFHTPPAKLQVIYEAAAADFQPASEAAIAQLRTQYQLTRPFMLSVGEQRPHKNHLGLIHAYAASASRQTHDLVIIGQAYQDYTAPIAAVRDLGLQDRVHFLTDVSHAALISAYSAASLFALVSFYEGFGLPILEAMRCGTPVLTAATTSAGEIVGTAGVTVDPADQPAITAAIDSILQHPDQRQVLIERGYAWEKQFTWQRAAEQTLAVYRRVVQHDSSSIY